MLIPLIVHWLWFISWFSRILIVATFCCLFYCYPSILIYFLFWRARFIIGIKIAWIDTFFFLYKVLSFETMILHFLLIKSQYFTSIFWRKFHFWLKSLEILIRLLLLIVNKLILLLFEVLLILKFLISWKTIRWWWLNLLKSSSFFSVHFKIKSRWLWWALWAIFSIKIELCVFFLLFNLFYKFLFHDQLLSFIFLIFFLIYYFNFSVLRFSAFTEKETFLFVVLLFLQNSIWIHRKIYNLSLLHLHLILF